MIMQTISIQIYLININFLITNIKINVKIRGIRIRGPGFITTIRLNEISIRGTNEASLKEGEVDQLESDIKEFKTPKN